MQQWQISSLVDEKTILKLNISGIDFGGIDFDSKSCQ
jgi:hypothetical protein